MYAQSYEILKLAFSSELEKSVKSIKESAENNDVQSQINCYGLGEFVLNPEFV